MADWDPSLMTGDQCALCEAPLEEQAFEIEHAGGELLRVCSACALRTPGHGQEEVADAVHEARQAAARLEEALLRRAEEAATMERTTDVLRTLAEELLAARTLVEDLQHNQRALEGDLARTRDRLRRAEELLAGSVPETDAPSGAGTAAPGEERVTPPAYPAHFPPHTPAVVIDSGALSGDEIHLVQRFFNESPFTEKLRSVRRSLGRPSVNLLPVASLTPQALLTVAWEIVWYQFLIRLEEAPEGEEQVELFGEGMELSELGAQFIQNNAGLDDQGRVDASELEFALMDDRSALISEMSPEEEAALEDATEEIWDRHAPPEFRWDD